MNKSLVAGILVLLTGVGSRLGSAEDAAVRVPALRADLEFLASDALRGRGSATPDELVAATYVAARLRGLGIEPAGDEGGYIQAVAVVRPEAGPAAVTIGQGPGALTLSHGAGAVFARGGDAPAVGRLLRVPQGQEVKLPPDAVVYLTRPAGAAATAGVASRLLRQGALAVLLAEGPEHARFAAEARAQPVSLPARRASSPPQRGHIVMLGSEAVQRLDAIEDGAPVRVEVALKETRPGHTWNVLGRIRGRRGGADEATETVVLSAHLDHVGMRDGAAAGADAIYNGADDDASGVAAVLSLAETLRAPKGGRQVILAFFGSEELGGLGSEYFVEHPPVPLARIVAAVQIEMVGRPDPRLPPSAIMSLTGYERSDLGASLAAQGAPVVADPRPEQSFFERSDNYRLAQAGVVAHTLSSFGMHADYHQPGDEVSRIDFSHLQAVVSGLRGSVQWLLDGSFTPQWKPGQKP